jgi:hypothetical protein
MSPGAIHLVLAALCVLVVLLMSLVSALFVLVEKLGRADDHKRKRLEAVERKVSRLVDWDEPTIRDGRPPGNGG